jgi:hypothetical protein
MKHRVWVRGPTEGMISNLRAEQRPASVDLKINSITAEMEEIASQQFDNEATT